MKVPDKKEEQRSEQTPRYIYLIVEFNCLSPADPDILQKAAHLHRVVQNCDWIQEVVAASGGLGGDLGSLWIFRLQSYAALDRLFHDRADEVSQAYTDFFSRLPRIQDRIREQVIFR